MGDSRCSLPFILNLLGPADAGSPANSFSSHNFSPINTQRHWNTVTEASSVRQLRPDISFIKPDSISHYRDDRDAHRGMPPTPPMSIDASFDGLDSPHSRSSSNIANGPAPPRYSPAPAKSAHYEPAPQQTLRSSLYVYQPLQASFYVPAQSPVHQQQPQVSGLYYQRPLPQQYNPPVPVNVALAPSSGCNPWQHHHYLTPSNGPSFPKSQGRYTCQTCRKPFKTPSTLRTHSHSHTGEKPFKCPHAGCGKAFSVRSNMKRHERGCDSFEVSGASHALIRI